LSGLGARTVGSIVTPLGQGPIAGATALLTGRPNWAPHKGKPVLSPDGRHLAVVSRLPTEVHVTMYDLVRGTASAAFRAPGTSIESPVLSQDGSRMAGQLFRGNENEVKVWDVAGGKEPLTLRGLTGQVHQLAF